MARMTGAGRWYVQFEVTGGFTLRRAPPGSHVHESWLNPTPAAAVAHYKEHLRKKYERDLAALDAALKAAES